VERGEEEVAGAISGEVAAGAVGPVGGGGQAEDDHPGVWVPEPRYGTAPVIFGGVGGLFLAGDLFAPLDEARAAPAGDDLLFEFCEALFVSGVGSRESRVGKDTTTYSLERSGFTRRNG
jgi:hypothetical protein